MDDNARSAAAVRTAARMLGAQWRVDVLLALLVGPLGFTELRSHIGASSKSLSQVLREMRRDGVIARETVAGDRRRTKYRLTAAGRALAASMWELARWYDQYGSR